MIVEALIRSEFEEWLNAIDDNKVVGIPRDSQRCPLALYLLEKTGEVHLVYRSYYTRSAYGDVPPQVPLPNWAYQFALGVDKLFDTVHGLMEVTAAQCRGVLSFIPRGEDENEARVA